MPCFETHVAAEASETDVVVEVTVAERDPVDPLDGALRRRIGRRLLEGAGFEIMPASAPVRAADPAAYGAVRRGRRGDS